MLDLCDTAYITKINKVFEKADTFIPDLDKLPQWEIVEKSETKEYNGTEFSFVTYERKERK